jgi:hypothetical protein
MALNPVSEQIWELVGIMHGTMGCKVKMAGLDQFLGIFLLVQMLITQFESLITCEPLNCRKRAAI